MKNEIIWLKCKWTREQLDDKTVEFRCRLRDNGAIATGTGKFDVCENPNGLLSILIDCDLPGRTQNEFVYQRFFVPQPAADAIEKHKTGLKDFECFPPI
jgi:hypothetical protein